MYRCLPALLLGLILSASTFSANEDGALPLVVHTVGESVSDENLFNPNHPVWYRAKEHPLHFHRTPPLYSNGPFDDGERPEVSVRLVRQASEVLFIKMQWLDKTKDEFLHGSRYPDEGENHIYKRHTVKTSHFGDAACLMIPQSRQPMEVYPSMMMGEKNNPVDLLFWQAGRGFSLLNAHGRASTQTAQEKADGRSFRKDNGWEAIFVLQECVDSTPICFAVWDGAKQHRNGLKYFSLWYEIKL